jgi:hypothetical protein
MGVVLLLVGVLAVVVSCTEPEIGSKRQGAFLALLCFVSEVAYV